jgi:hypothetical protein
LNKQISQKVVLILMGTLAKLPIFVYLQTYFWWLSGNLEFHQLNKLTFLTYRWSKSKICLTLNSTNSDLTVNCTFPIPDLGLAKTKNNSPWQSDGERSPKNRLVGLDQHQRTDGHPDGPKVRTSFRNLQINYYFNFWIIFGLLMNTNSRTNL